MRARMRASRIATAVRAAVRTTVRTTPAVVAVVAIVAGAALVDAAPVDAALVDAAPRPAPGAGGPLADLIDALPTSPPLDSGFAYRKFVPTGMTRDRDGCTPRQRALVAAAVVPPRVHRPACSLTGGSWSTFDGRRARDARQVRILPVLSAREAWTQGAYGWGARQRRAFGTTYPTPRPGPRKLPDPRDWVTAGRLACAGQSAVAAAPMGCGYVVAPSARYAGSPSLLDHVLADPATATCAEVDTIATTVRAWGLSVDRGDKAVLARIARDCGASAGSAANVNTVNGMRRVSANNPFSAASDSRSPNGMAGVLSATPGRPIPASLFGLHVPAGQATRPDLPYGRLRIWDSDMAWSNIEPRRGEYHWELLDNTIAAAQAQGLAVTYVIGSTPPWAGRRATDPPTRLADFRRFTDKLTRRYGSAIESYEVWNEPNLQTYYTGTVGELVAMTTALKASVTAARARSLVLAPSTTTRTTPSFYGFYANYVRALGRAGWPVDGFALHSYPPANGGPAEHADGIALFKGMLDLSRAPDLPIHETEINYGLGGLTQPTRPILGADAQGYLAQTFISAVRYGLSAVDWYLWTDRAYPLIGVQLNPGSTGTQAAWRWTYEHLVGASLLACADQGPASVCGFRRDGSTFALAFATSADRAQITVPAGLTRACDMDGTCRDLTDATVTVGVRPIELSAPPSG